MRKLLLVVSVLSVLGVGLLSTQSNAQQGQTGRGAKMMERLTTALSLTPAQVSQIQPIIDADRTKMMQIRNDSTLTDDQQAAQLKQLRQQEAAQIKPILTPDQLAKWKTMMAKWRTNHSGGGQGATGGGGQTSQTN